MLNLAALMAIEGQPLFVLLHTRTRSECLVIHLNAFNFDRMPYEKETPSMKSKERDRKEREIEREQSGRKKENKDNG